jgi:tRNA 2-selenouridine synthase
MSNLIQSSEFKSFVLLKTPLIDVRAPIEFKKGAFPYSVNLPLLTDEERHLVGIKYKNSGNKEAMILGHNLVSGEVKESRVKAWLDFKKLNPEAVLYCFRGGQRSKISQEWMNESSCDIVRLKGGYKAFRNYLMNELDDAPKNFKAIILGGRTGSGKTILLNKIQNSIDLEGLANHRGSAFGRKISVQPTQINFENNLAYDLIQKLDKGPSHLLFEDEGKHVGSVYLPKNFANYLSISPLIVLESSFEERIEITFDEYIIKAQESYQDSFKNNAFELWCSDTENSMAKIQKKLGSMRYKIVCDLFKNAVNIQKTQGSLDSYKEWISYLLSEYYDLMYDYQLEKNKERIQFRGSLFEVINYLEDFKIR